MTTILILQLSLNVPNRFGNPQLMMEDCEGHPVFFYTLKEAMKSKKTDAIYIICSQNQVDDCIASLVSSLKNDSSGKPLHCIRVENGKEWSFELKNIRRAKNKPQIIIDATGINNLNFFFQLSSAIRFDSAVIAAAESVPLLDSAEVIDTIILESDNSTALYTGRHPDEGYLLFINCREANDIFQELKSEIIQTQKQKESMIKAKGASGQKIEAYNRFLSFPFTIQLLLQKVQKKENWLLKLKAKGHVALNPFFSLANLTDLNVLKQIFGHVNKLENCFASFESTLRNLLSEKMLKAYQSFDRIIAGYYESGKLNSGQLIIDMSDHLNEDISRLDKILSLYNSPPALIRFGCFKEPVCCQHLELLIEKARQLEIFTGIKTSEVLVSNDLIEKIVKKGLNFILIDLDKMVPDERAFSYIGKLIELKASFENKYDLLIYLQISLTDINQSLIKKLFNDYEYVVDNIIVLPAGKREDFLLNLDPFEVKSGIAEENVTKWEKLLSSIRHNINHSADIIVPYLHHMDLREITNQTEESLPDEHIKNEILKSLNRIKDNLHFYFENINLIEIEAGSKLEKEINGLISEGILNKDTFRNYHMKNNLTEIETSIVKSFNISVLKSIFPEMINFDALHLQNKNFCRWAMNTSVFNTDSSIYLCEEYGEEKWEVNSGSISEVSKMKGSHKICETCTRRKRFNGFEGSYPAKDIIISDTNRDILPRMGLNIIFNRLKDEKPDYENIKDIICNLLKIGILNEDFTTRYSEMIDLALNLIKKEKFMDALDILEIILKTDPSNNEVHKIIDSISSVISPAN